MIKHKLESKTNTILQVPDDQRPSYAYEFTSSQFEQNTAGELAVKTVNLDRDAPNQPVLIVQVSVTQFLAICYNHIWVFMGSEEHMTVCLTVNEFLPQIIAPTFEKT